MLTTPDILLFLHLLVDDLQDKLLHHLYRDGGEVVTLPSVQLPQFWLTADRSQYMKGGKQPQNILHCHLPNLYLDKASTVLFSIVSCGSYEEQYT